MSKSRSRPLLLPDAPDAPARHPFPDAPEGGINLGRILDETAQADAIHVAVAPVRTACSVSPGEHVGFAFDGDTEHVSPQAHQKIGIIDPFLPGKVAARQRVYLFLYPYTVTSLRHTWVHPAFVAQRAEARLQEVQAAEEWLTGLARECALSYPEFLQALRDFRQTGERFCLGTDTPDRCWQDAEMMWRYYGVVTGDVFCSDSCAFRCAC